MAYDIDARSGLPMVGGIPLPLTPQQMQAAGIGPASQAPVANMPGGIPLPQGGNPYGGLPPDAVAGIGGGPVVQQSSGDIGAPMAPVGAHGPGVAFAPGVADPYARFRVYLDNGAAPAAPPGLASMAAQQQAAIDLRRGMTPAEAAAQSAAGTLPPEAARFAEKVESPKVGATGAQPLKLIPTVGEAQQSAAANPAGTMSAAAQAAYDATMAGGRAGPAKLVTTSETVKSTQLGAVPEKLSGDIADQEADIDRQQAAASDMTAVAATHSLQQQAEVIRQQQADAAAAQAERARVDQRISSLQAKSDSDEAAMVQAKPQGIKDYWGGSMLAQMISGLSLALGAGVQTRTGVNPAEQMLDKSIDRWVNDQKQQYDAAKDKATLSNNKYKDALQTFGTPEAAQAQLRLQSLAAKNALAQNMAEQSKVPQWLANAQLEQQRTALQQKQLSAQSIQQAGMTTTEATKKLQGGPGSGLSAADRIVKAYKNAADVTTSARIATGTTNEDVRTGVEVAKQQGAGQLAHVAITDAADSLSALRRQTSSVTGRVGGGAGITDAQKTDAIMKLTAAYQASNPRMKSGTATEQAKALLEGIEGATRLTPKQDEKLREAEKLLRGDAVRAAARHASGSAAPETSDDEIGATE